MSRLAWLFVLLALVVPALCGCSSKTPYTNRSQFIIMSSSKELALGAQAAEDVLKTEKESHDPTYVKKVTTVGRRIADAADQPSFDWEYHVIDNPDTANAFCLPGGKIFVYTGLFKYATTDAQLAAVIGHEAAHAIARHGAERMSMSTVAQITQQVAVAAAGAKGGSGAGSMVGTAFGLGATYGVLMPYGRSQESEADRIGIILMAKAGYNPSAALDFWQAMAEGKGGASMPEFLSTHPADQTRIADIKKWLPEALSYYRPSASGQ
jgi:predicted Zn-dependent protease